MTTILYNPAFTAIYIAVAAVPLITIIALDMKRIKMIRKHTEAVKENTAVYNKLLDESARAAKTYEQYGETLESYREAINRAARLCENLVQIFGQEGDQDTWSE